MEKSKLNHTEAELIAKFRQAGAARWSQDPHYREQMFARLELNQSRPGPLYLIKSIMNSKSLIGGIAAVAVIAVAGVAFALNNQPTQPAGNNGGNNQSASALPAEKVASLNQAQAKLSYKIQLPTNTLGASLTDIVVGQKLGMIDNSDTIYLTYVKSGGALFKVSATTLVGNDPEDVKQVDLGNNVKGSYYFIGGEETPGVAIGGAMAPRSYLFWKVDGVRFEVSEFGQVSEAELTEIAKSFQQI